MYGFFGREITKYTVIYDVYIRFWPTLLIQRHCVQPTNLTAIMFCSSQSTYRRRRARDRMLLSLLMLRLLLLRLGFKSRLKQRLTGCVCVLDVWNCCCCCVLVSKAGSSGV